VISLAAVDWREVAACSGYDPELWYAKDSKPARKICSRCPAREACLAAALVEEAGLSERHRFGVRGGHSAADRAAMDSPGLAKRRPAQRIIRKQHAA
jgi:WhiB family redox-sensing transcriptional regulator